MGVCDPPVEEKKKPSASSKRYIGFAFMWFFNTFFYLFLAFLSRDSFSAYIYFVGSLCFIVIAVLYCRKARKVRKAENQRKEVSR